VLERDAELEADRALRERCPGMALVETCSRDPASRV
jgi:hypothetical protein